MDDIMQPNYYTTYLKAYLTAARDHRKADDAFIEDRTELASAEYEERRRDGMTVFGAQECAMKVLLEGLE